MKAEQILYDAVQLLSKDRHDTYGSALRNHERIAELWTTYLDYKVTAEDVAICMTLVKISRIAADHGNLDSHIDATAYMAIAGECADARRPKP